MFCVIYVLFCLFFFFQAEDGIRDRDVTGVQTCALPIYEGGDQHEETEEEAAPECDARPWKPPAHPVEQAAVERPVGRGGRRPLAAAAEETAQEAALDRLRDHRPAAELGHRAQQPVPGGSL